MSKGMYRIDAKKDSADITIYEDIGEGWFGGLSAKQFADDLKKVGDAKQLNVFINSAGGNVFDGLAIYNTLKRHPANVIVSIDGIAASIASIIAMAGDEIIMAENSFMMIHDPWTAVVGTADDMRDMAETMDKVREQLLSTYVKRSGADKETISNMMQAETWLTADEAKELGLADTLSEPLQIAAYVDKSLMSKYKHVPEKVFQRVEDMERPRIRNITSIRAYMNNSLKRFS